MQTLVTIRDVHKEYKRGAERIDVLQGANLQIGRGEFLALMGPSGSGKTTLLNLVGGLDRPTRGSIDVDGVRIDQLSESALSKWRARHVGFVFQLYNLLPVLTAERNVELPLLLMKLSRAERRKRVGTALRVVSLADRRLWYRKNDETIYTTGVAVGSGRSLVQDGTRKEWKFDTPRGRLVVQSKEIDPVWVPPDWSVKQAHDSLERVEHALCDRFPATEIIIHLDPEGHKDRETLLSSDLTESRQ